MEIEKKLSSVSFLADLARLDLKAGEKRKRELEFREIVKYVDRIEAVKVAAQPLVTTISGVADVLRDDWITESTLADALLEQAPERRRRFIRVPIILSR